MKYVLAYGLVIALVRFCFMLGMLFVAFPVAGCLAWAPERLRGVAVGIVSGLGSVAAAVAFGYFIFWLVLGSNAFGLLPLLAATVPLVIPIRKDLAQARLLSEDVTKLRHLRPGTETGFVAAAVGGKFKVIGCILGLVLTFLWFFLVHENVA